MDESRFFKIIVLGGFALLGPPACGSTVSGVDAAGADLAPDVAADVTPDLVDVTAEFPREGPVRIDSGAPDADATTTIADVADAGDGCICEFPRETAIDFCHIDWCHPDASDVVDASDAAQADAVEEFPREGPPPPPDGGL